MEPTKYNLFVEAGGILSPVGKVGAFYQALQSGPMASMTVADLAVAIGHVSTWLEEPGAQLIVRLAGTPASAKIARQSRSR